MSAYEVWKNDASRVPVFAWVKGVPLEPGAVEQALLLSRMPWAFHHIAIMPDVHIGYGSTVGSVIATANVLMPAAVGVDIGCGMAAVRTNLPVSHIEGRLPELRTAIEKVVPCGFGRGGPVGMWGDAPEDVEKAWRENFKERYAAVCADLPAVEHRDPVKQLGTLGSGNHFVEVCRDLDGFTWVMLHSGSRGPGNRIGTQYAKLAKHHCERWHTELPHADLAFFPQGSEEYGDYWKAVTWAQDYARINRDLMLNHVLETLAAFAGFVEEDRVTCHHNYVASEHHYGKDVLVTRKGAVRACAGDRCIIPGSMGAKSYIVEGLGCRESFMSCSHGAGRVMSRTRARAEITEAQHVAATAGVECDKTADTIDESPAAYKDLDLVLAAEADLVRPVVQLKQVLCVKGKS